MAGFTPFQIYGLIGFPLGHSLSPLIHTTAFRALGISAVLAPWPVPPEKLPAFLDAFRLLNIQGACVTIPHKEAVLPLLDEVTERARALGAVNLLCRRGELIVGDNTDLPGFLAPLSARPPAAGARALILGAGGAARAAAAGLRALGLTDITVTSRAAGRAETLARALGLKAAAWEKRGRAPAEVVVNATPLGQRGELEGRSGYEAEWFAGRSSSADSSADSLAYDLVYNPQETKFIQDARAAGWRTVGGLAMFLGQAEAQFLAWTGRPLPEAAKRAVYDALR